MSIEIFDTVAMTVKRAVKATDCKYKINEEMYSIIRGDCKELDIMNEEFEFDSFEIFLDKNNNALAIKIITPDITFSCIGASPFFEIIKHTSKFMFSNKSSTDICMTLVYENILEA